MLIEPTGSFCLHSAGITFRLRFLLFPFSFFSSFISAVFDMPMGQHLLWWAWNFVHADWHTSVQVSLVHQLLLWEWLSPLSFLPVPGCPPNSQNLRRSFPLSQLAQIDEPVKKVTGGACTNGMVSEERSTLCFVLLKPGKVHHGQNMRSQRLQFFSTTRAGKWQWKPYFTDNAFKVS